MVKCIAIDMDGTLLTAAQTISKQNKAAIEKAQKMGIEIIIATGRSYQEASFLLKEAGIHCPVICANGAEVRSEEGEVIASNPLMKADAKLAAVRLAESGVYYEVYTNKGTFTNDKDKGIAVIVDIFMSANPDIDVDLVVEGAEERFEKGMVREVEDYRGLFSGNEYDIHKLLAFSFDLEQLAAAKKAVEDLSGMVVTSSGQENLEITSEKAQKGVALEAFVKNRGISLQDTMAIGDNFNDLSMFKRVGRSVAMGNASEIIKAQCDYITLTNEEDGVATAIFAVL